MDVMLFRQALAKFALGLTATMLLLFVPAGTLAYWNAWLFIGLLFIPMFIAGLFLMARHPDLLRKRLRMKEAQAAQRRVILLSGLLFLAGFALCGLNHRFQWLVLPKWAVAMASVIFLLAYLLYAQVLRENAYLSRTVEIQEGQRVIDTGLYGIIRHPMYAATILLFLSMPLVLGSVQAFVLFCAYPLLLARRIENEEKVLEEGLPGYADYKRRVKYRIIPLIW